MAGPLALVITTIGSVVPSSPGALGVYHALVVLALAMFDVDIERALAYAILLHGLSVGLHIALGVAAVYALGLTRHCLRLATTRLKGHKAA